MVCMTVGTGIGGGVVIDGELLRGAHGVAAELGHMRVVPGGHRCGCGARGCWEQYASGRALVREGRAQAESGSLAAAQMLSVCGITDPAELTGPMITEAAAGGDPCAVELLDDLGRWLGEGLASIATLFDPSTIVIGGGVSAAKELLLKSAQVAFEKNLPAKANRPHPAFGLAELGNDAGLIGAADLARSRPRRRSSRGEDSSRRSTLGTLSGGSGDPLGGSFDGSDAGADDRDRHRWHQGRRRGGRPRGQHPGPAPPGHPDQGPAGDRGRDRRDRRTTWSRGTT